VAENEAGRVEVLSAFFHGDNDGEGLDGLVQRALADIDPRDMVAFDLGVDPVSGSRVVVRPGRKFGRTFSPYIECGERTRSVPDAIDPMEVSLEWALARLDAPRVKSRVLGEHPQSGEGVVVVDGRYGPFVSCGGETRSVGDVATFESITLDAALALLAVPKPPRRGRRR
jgi:DNA topoisomerase-1